jgi:hypothetical protein
MQHHYKPGKRYTHRREKPILQQHHTGTAPIGSRECYTCRVQGHITRDHDPAIPPVNTREQRWRAFIGRNLFNRGRIDYNSVAQINTHDEETLPYDPAIYNAEQLDFTEEHDNQGNGEEAHE